VGRGSRGCGVPVREPRQAVLERDRLALLGELQAAGRLALRLRGDRLVRRSAPPAGAAPAAVEDGQLDTAPPCDLGEGDERAADLPLRREVPRVLRRVR